MKIYLKILYTFLATTLLLSCGGRKTTSDADIVVSIEPIKYIIEQITLGDFDIEVLVPQGASPETFDPTPRQAISLNNTKLVFATGLIDFEQELLKRLENRNIIDLSHGIELIEGSCSHAHHNHTHAHHSHGVDPHIWTSPQELRVMAKNAYNAIAQLYPDSTQYAEAYNKLAQELESLDVECRSAIKVSNTTAFAIYHPALTYYARAYSLEQIAIEDEGKEPSAKHIAHIIDETKEKGVTSLLYQSEYPRSVVDVVAKDMGIEPTEINPLAGNPLQFIRDITRTITNKKE
ncbi:MAG: zinc ABC transporter substrate-binding protein [Alistipes sp.]|nr:zinc ABC transporter substrate-binding protein [Alistipes sp.]